MLYQLYPAKIPNLLKFEHEPFFEGKERKKERHLNELLAKGRDSQCVETLKLDESNTIRWRFKKDLHTDGPVLGPDRFPTVSSEWGGDKTENKTTTSTNFA